MKNEIYVGDNLATMYSNEFAKHKNSIQFIYIDPPYNTITNNFAYNDNNEKWSKDIKKRLIIAKEMLAPSGVIFISIDDNELASLLNICYEVFGKSNYVGLFITKQAQRSNAKFINTVHEYIVAFAKNKKKLPRFYIKRLENPSEAEQILAIIRKVKSTFKKSKESAKNELKQLIDKYMIATGETWIKNYSHIDDEGNIFFAKDLSTPGKPSRLDIEEINLYLEPLKTRGWSSKEKILKLHSEKRLFYKNGRPYEIHYLEEATNNVPSILDFYSRQGTNDLNKLGLYNIFETPKPVEMIKFLIRCTQHEDATILDFYAGSGTTAQAVYEINKEDNMSHRYILIQLDEMINPKSPSYSVLKGLGYSKPRIDHVMIHRINTYLTLNDLPIDYIVKEKVYE